MKKRHLLLVVTLVLTCLVFTGCGRNDEGGSTQTSEVQNDFMDGAGVDEPLNDTGSDLNLGGDGNAQGNTGMGQSGENGGSAGNGGNAGSTGASGEGGNTSSDSTNGASGTGTEETSSVTGVITEIKDFMFVIEDNEGTAYGFTFESEMPQGLEDVTEGDEVIVTYTGEVSEVDAFTGEVISVEKVENTNQ